MPIPAQKSVKASCTMPSIKATSSSRSCFELAFAAPLGQAAVVLPDEHHQVFRNPVRHLDGIHDAADGFVVAAQIVDLARQVVARRCA